MRVPFRRSEEERARIEEEKRKARDVKADKEYAARQEKLDRDIKNTKQTYTYKNLLERLKFETYTKRLVGFIVGFGLLDMQLSYALAFLDKTEIAETLSTQVCTTILGTALIYMVRAYFDTKAEKSDERAMETVKKDAESKILDQVRETLYDAGIEIPSDVEKLAQFKTSMRSDDESEDRVSMPIPDIDEPEDADDDSVG